MAMRSIGVLGFLLLCQTASPGVAAADGRWVIAGRQGIVIDVIVPAAQARDKAAYEREIGLICAAQPTCFVNFYTNTDGVALATPLPEAITKQPTAVLRQSAKQGTAGLRWSCRLGLAEPNCF